MSYHEMVSLEGREGNEDLFISWEERSNGGKSRKLRQKQGKLFKNWSKYSQKG